MKELDKYRGCLIGGAVGDALGYAVEFISLSAIRQRYGEHGITEYDLIDGVAQISDDTQMTLFTANGLLLGKTRGMTRGIMGKYEKYIFEAYKDWYKTQECRYPLPKEARCAWLADVPALFSRRAPGNTCMAALASGIMGKPEKPINHSKGCGGVMRVAPIGLYFDVPKEKMDQIDLLGAKAAAITHGHELGYIPAAALTHLVGLAAHEPDMSLLEIALDMQSAMRKQFEDAVHLDRFSWLMKRAIELSQMDTADQEAIFELGEGWVGEEALAIALYCALKHSDDFEKAMIAAVNHSGDSDSTGAIAGNILGAYLGMKAIPQKFLERLELKEIILEVADDLYSDCRINEYTMDSDPQWFRKYVQATNPFAAAE